jgi:hypothetical protein
MLEATMQWVTPILEEAHMSMQEFHESVKLNLPLWEYLWVIRFLVNPYCFGRLKVRLGDVPHVLEDMKFWQTPFYGANKV